MNDPHVAALHYRIDHGPFVDFDPAPPLEHDQPGFSVRIADYRAEITLRTHYPTPDDARAVIEPFLHAWEISSTLQLQDGDAFRFVYDYAAVIDRRPTADQITRTTGIARGHAVAYAIGHTQFMRYPDPPNGTGFGEDTWAMCERYRLYRSSRATLSDAANFCLTVAVKYGRGQKGAATRYGVSESVLRKLGELAATKGGHEARKAAGVEFNFSQAEREWLETVMKSLIRRASQVAYRQSATQPKITMADLPQLK